MNKKAILTKRVFFATLVLILLILSLIFLYYTISNSKKESPLVTSALTLYTNIDRLSENISTNKLLNIIKNPPSWYYEEITRNLNQEKLKDKLHLKEIYDKSDPSALLMYVEIKNNQIFYQIKTDYYRWRFLLNMFLNISKIINLPDITFIITAYDGYSGDIAMLTFATNKSVANNAAILIPDDLTLTSWSNLYLDILKANNKYLWKNKEEKIFWRGKSTGIPCKYCKIHTGLYLPRSQFVYLSLIYPDIIDAKFTGFPQINNEEKKVLKSIFKKANHIKQDEQLRFKYLINIDGDTCTYPGLAWRLSSNSVVIKQETNEIQWFYSQLKPYIHYVPVQEDFSDIFHIYDWLRANDDQAQIISQNAQKFVQENLTVEHMYAYLYLVLKEISNIYSS